MANPANRRAWWSGKRAIRTACVAMAALLAIPLTAFADDVIDMPTGNRSIGPEYRMSFRLRDGDPRPLAEDHRSKCAALGPTRCQLIHFQADRSWSSVRLLLAPGTTPAFMANISKVPKNADFTVESVGSPTPNQRELAELKLRKQLLEAQRDKLNSLQKSVSDEQIQQFLSMQASIEGQIKQIDAQMGNFGKSSAIETLNITYNSEGRTSPSRVDRAFDALGSQFLLGILIVTGVALLTSIYFGIIALMFLWIRKFAIGRGLIEGQ